MGEEKESLEVKRINGQPRSDIKYALHEIERRFVVEPSDFALHSPTQIIDLYAHDTRLRLRKMDGRDGVIFKLTKKYGDRRGPTESIVTAYLDRDEYELFNDMFAGFRLVKIRYKTEFENVDVDLLGVSDGAHSVALAIAEVNFLSVEDAEQFAPIGNEVTGDAEYSGPVLARRFGVERKIVNKTGGVERKS